MYQEYEARHAIVRAMEVIPVGSTDRLFVVDGVGVIDAATFAALYETKRAPAEAKRTKPVTKRLKSDTKARIPETRMPSVMVAELLKPIPATELKTDRKPTLLDQVIAVIEKHGPLTSSDVYERIRQQGIATTQGSVYQACRDLKERSRLESRTDDDNDGKRKWFLPANGASAGAAGARA
jgi:hypothetical protein